VQWLHEGIAGLSSAAPGYRKIRIAPLTGGGLSHASSSVNTPFGLAKSSWSLDADREIVKLEVVMPPGTAAEVHIGKSRVKHVGSGSHIFEYHHVSRNIGLLMAFPEPRKAMGLLF